MVAGDRPAAASGFEADDGDGVGFVDDDDGATRRGVEAADDG